MRTILALTALLLGAWPGVAQPARETGMHPTQSRTPARVHARAKITVESQQSAPFDQTGDPALTVISLTERFAGDIDAQSNVRALGAMRPDKSASLVSLQRVQGTLGGRRGAFVLQGEETVSNGQVKATWSVVPGSGTGELVGLRGDGGFAGAFGQGSEGTLDYWFE
jgi:uncharacterized protein DUF3224